MDKLKLNQFKKMLLQRQQELTDIHVSRDEEIDIDGGDEIDMVQAKILKNNLEKLAAREVETLKRIKESLKKIEDGTYGICESCEEPIGEKRLSAIMVCKTCIECAEKQEKHAKQYRA